MNNPKTRYGQPISTLEKLFIKAAPWLIALAAVLTIVVLFAVNRTNKYAQETAAYTRVSNCILGKSALQTLTQQQVEACYTQVEKTTGLPLERFDNQTHNEAN